MDLWILVVIVIVAIVLIAAWWDVRHGITSADSNIKLYVSQGTQIMEKLNELEQLIKSQSPNQSIVEIKENGQYCIVLGNTNELVGEDSVQEIVDYFKRRNAEVIVIVS